MVNYSNGKIYKIESDLGDLIYIGSTTKYYLSQRMERHRFDYVRRCTYRPKLNLTAHADLTIASPFPPPSDPHPPLLVV